MKVIFMGTPEFGAVSLDALIKQPEIDVAAVVTQPDKPNKRGKKVVYMPVKQMAADNGIDILQPEKLKDAGIIEKIKSYAPDMIIVAAYGKILPKEILDIPPMGCINVHGSLLPKYRGAAPIQWAIINGEKITGATIIHMSDRLDAGDMILKKQVLIHSNDCFKTVHDSVAKAGAGALIEAIKLIQSEESVRILQNDAEATYAPMITKLIRRINWDETGENIENLVRALSPHPGAFTTYKGAPLKIYSGESLKLNNCENKTFLYPESDFGEVVDVINDKGIVIKTNGGSFLITELQPQYGKRMTAADFVRGSQVKKGDLLV